MRRRWKIAFLLFVVVAITFVPIQTIRWDGGFDSEEYHLTFTHPDGRPVPEVKLRVETKAGGVCHFYPVNEFLRDATAVSDTDGKMTFHHVSHSLEFGGREDCSLVGVCYGESHAPRYVCVFLLDGREVHRIPFDELRLRAEWKEAPRVRRMWRFSDLPAREYIAHSENWERRQLELFDGNGDGKLDREERTARGYFDRNVSYQVELKNHPFSKEHEIEFAVRERTVVLSAP